MQKLKTNPVPFFIAIAVSSNLQGAATLVGDTTAIMLGSALDMSFMDFFWYLGKPSMFFAVELGAVLSAIIGPLKAIDFETLGLLVGLWRIKYKEIPDVPIGTSGIFDERGLPDEGFLKYCRARMYSHACPK